MYYYLYLFFLLYEKQDLSVIEFLETPAKRAKVRERERGGSPQWLITTKQRNNEVNQGNTKRRKVTGLVAVK